MNGKKYRMVAIIVSISLFASVIKETTIESKAFVLETAIAFELLQAALMSVGITVVGYDALKRLFASDGKEERFNDIIDNLNAYDDGLGTRLELVIHAASLSGSGWTISMDEETFDRLKALSAAIADGYQFSMGESEETQVISNADGLVSSSLIAIPYSLYPMHPIPGGKILELESLPYEYWGVKGLANYNDFLQAINNEYGAISSVYQYDKLGDIPHSCCIVYFAAVDGSPLAGASVSEKDGQRYLRGYDQDGNLVDIAAICMRIDLNSKKWIMGYHDVRKGESVPLWFSYEYAYLTMLDAVVKLPGKSQVNDEVKSEVLSGVYDVVTPGRTLVDSDSLIKNLVGNIAITLPHGLDMEKELDGVISGVKPITDVLPKIGVYPVDTALDQAIADDKTIADTIAEADAAAAAVPSVGQYDLGLANFFPFCIPFDFAGFIRVLKAEPEAPSFKINMPTGFSSEEGVIYTEYEISLKQFDDAAYWLRRMELLAFIIGLMLATRQMFIRA